MLNTHAHPTVNVYFFLKISLITLGTDGTLKKIIKKDHRTLIGSSSF